MSSQGRVFVNVRTTAANTEIVSFANSLVKCFIALLTSPAANNLKNRGIALNFGGPRFHQPRHYAAKKGCVCVGRRIFSPKLAMLCS